MGRGAHTVRMVGVLVAGFALAACGTETGGSSGSGGGTDAPLTGVRWVPQSITVDGEKYEAPPSTNPYVTFDPGVDENPGGNTGADLGCNSIGADVTVEGDTVLVSELLSTSMGCPGPVGRFEDRFLDVFGGELSVEFSDGGDKLVLTGEDGNRITFEAEGAAGAE